MFPEFIFLQHEAELRARYRYDGGQFDPSARAGHDAAPRYELRPALRNLGRWFGRAARRALGKS